MNHRHPCLFTILLCHAAVASERVPLEQIEKRLAANPAQLQYQPQRVEILKQLDTWALAPDTVYHDMKPDTSNAEWVAFYLRRMVKALDEIAATDVGRGAVVWKMYSSGFVVKAPEGVLAIDVVEGPFKSIHKSPDEYPGFAFKWTPDMRRRYARLVDVHLVTHWHYDHASYALCRALAESGKVVVVPAQLERVWAPKMPPNALRVVEEQVDLRVGPFTVQIFDGAQGMSMNEQKEWVIDERFAQNNIYWFRVGGVQFLHKGDHRGEPWYDWLAALKAHGKGIDVFFSMVAWPRGLHGHMAREFDPIIVPAHEHEVGHKPRHGVSLLASHYRGLGQARLERGKGVVLVWGERLVLGEAAP